MPNAGMQIRKHITRPPTELIQRFKGLPVATIADSMNRMFCMAAKLRPINPTPLLGPAFTIKCRPGDNLLLHKAIDLAEPGDILVVDAHGDISHALIGELMVQWARKRSLGGFVIDGAVRDIAFLKSLDMPIYAAGVTPAGPYKDGPGEINAVISCGGVAVTPGDIVIGDADGLVIVRPKDATDVLQKTQEKIDVEKRKLEAIANGTADRSWIDRDLLAHGCEYID